MTLSNRDQFLWRSAVIVELGLTLGSENTCRVPIMLVNNGSNNPDNEDEVETDSAGPSGDIQGLSHPAEADSESVEELAEGGNSFEASVVDGVENAKDPDVSEVVTRQVPQDDVPQEYLDDEHVA